MSSDKNRKYVILRKTPDEFPDDILNTTYGLLNEWASSLTNDPRLAKGLIGNAILAERMRCADIAKNWRCGLRPGSHDRLLGHMDAAEAIATAILPPNPGVDHD